MPTARFNSGRLSWIMIPILLLAAAGMFVRTTYRGQSPNAARTAVRIHTFALVLDAYKREYHSYPRGIPEVILAVLMARNRDDQNPKHIVFLELRPDEIDGQGRWVDGWHRPFLIRSNAEGTEISIQSLGENGINDGGKEDDRIGINKL